MTTAQNPVGWFEIYVDDMDRAKSFYEKALGVTLDQTETVRWQSRRYVGVSHES